MSTEDIRFNRNLGFISAAEQEGLYGAHVAVAGAGGDGGLLALQLARMGVGQISLADPEKFEEENINRQACCTSETVGMNKAEAVASVIKKINPDIVTTVYTDGVQPENVNDFIGDANLVIDETEFTTPEVGTMIARQSRAADVPVLMALNIGFGAYVTSFHPKGKSFESFLGLDPKMPLSEVAKQQVPLSRWLGHIPSYADLKVLERVASGEVSAPSIAPGVAIAAGTAATQALLHISNEPQRKKPIFAPRGISIDPIDGTRHVRSARAGYYTSLAKMVLNNKRHKVVLTNY